MEDADPPWLDIDLASLHQVTDPDQAAVVADPARSRFLHPFLGRALTVSEAAAELDCSPNAMLYRVRRMVDLRLLHVVSTRTRPGRPVKVYRSVHDGYFVPMDVMRYDDLRHRVASQGRVLVNQLIDAYTAVLAASTDSGRVLARNRVGELWATDLLPTRNRHGQPTFLCDLTITLSADQADQIRDTLASAMHLSLAAERSSNPLTPNGASYLFMAGLLPLPE